jgi:hypothetical protein
VFVSRFMSLMWGSIACIAVQAAPPTFKIDSLYSNLDGSVQFIRLTETEGLNGQNRLKGLKLTSTHNGVTKEYTFVNDIPTEYTARVSIVVVAAPRGVPRNQPSAWGCCWHPYRARAVLPVDGGARLRRGRPDGLRGLPTNGTHAQRDGTTGPHCYFGPANPPAERDPDCEYAGSRPVPLPDSESLLRIDLGGRRMLDAGRMPDGSTHSLPRSGFATPTSARA